MSQVVFAQGVQIEKAPTGQQSPAAPTPPTPAGPTPAEALYDFIQKYRPEVAKFHVGTRYLWTDRILIEIADSPPPEPLASLLAVAPNNTSQFSTWVNETFEKQVKTWRPGKRNPNPGKPGTDEIVDAAGGHFYVNPVYVSYVLARYPKASILIKGPSDPVLFTVNNQVKAILATWTHLPDGTPLQ
ncbi:MAG TPA: hypothetical protein VJ719_14205 [Chthoniobacterales bacterium]|nr:hypothetical protein [Chthoniobacterales bacterium]